MPVGTWQIGYQAGHLALLLEANTTEGCEHWPPLLNRLKMANKKMHFAVTLDRGLDPGGSEFADLRQAPRLKPATQTHTHALTHTHTPKHSSQIHNPLKPPSRAKLGWSCKTLVSLKSTTGFPPCCEEAAVRPLVCYAQPCSTSTNTDCLCRHKPTATKHQVVISTCDRIYRRRIHCRCFLFFCRLTVSSGVGSS